MNPKVSIIIPVYGVERFIARCAHSLFSQSFKEIEYIFVNDCTLDSSIEVLKDVLQEYPERAEQVQIVTHKSNQGLPVARRTGLNYAKGDFILHCDSDDWLADDAVEILYNTAIQKQADVVICDFYASDGKERKRVKACRSTDKQSLLKDMLNGKAYWSVWNKLVNRELYKSVKIWTTKNVCEDLVLTMQIMNEAEEIAYTEDPLYYYFQNTESMTRVLTKEGVLKRFNEATYNAKTISDYLLKINDSLDIKFAVDNMLFRQRNLLTGFTQDRSIYDLWRNTFKHLHYSVIFNPFISTKKKGKFYLTLLRLYNNHF